MDDLRLVLIVIGLLAIGGLLLHGLWSSRRERPAKFNEKPLSKLSQRDNEGYDQDGIGEVRVVKCSTRQEPNFGFTDEDADPLFARQEEPEEAFVPHFQANEQAISMATVQAESVADSAAESLPMEPERVDAPALDTSVATDATTEPEAMSEPESVIIVLHVAAAREQMFQGVRLVNSLERNGLQYGEMKLFHRYVTLAGTQEILFSAASMINPGIIELDRLDKFETPGISLFMRVPSYGDGLQNFKLMLQCAQQIADELNGEVWDDERQILTPQRIDSYRQRIKSVQ